jgi:hypothetical protein
VRLFWINQQGRRTPYGTLAAGDSKAQHTYSGHVWLVEAVDGAPLGVFEGRDTESEAVIEPARREAKRRERREEDAPREWRGFIREGNVWIRHRDSGEEGQLSRDGSADDPYREPFLWSPDGTKLVVQQIKPAQEHKVYVVESSPGDQLQPKLQKLRLPQGRRPHCAPPAAALRRFFAAACARGGRPLSQPWELGNFHWSPDSSRFYFLYNQRGHQLERIVAIDAKTGETSTVVEERSETFIDYSQKTYLRWLG